MSVALEAGLWEARGQAPLSEIDTSRGMAYGDDVMVEDYLLEVDE